MREHPESGRSILEDIPFLAGAREIVYAHHERWDGRATRVASRSRDPPGRADLPAL